MKMAYTRPDGGVSIISPSARHLGTFKTEAEGIAAIKAKDIPSDATDIVEIDDSPTDREFRNAWTHVGGVFDVDMVKAKDIQVARVEKAKRKNARDLLEREMTGENIASEKAALQAVDTSPINAAQNPAALKAAWPSALKR